MDGIISIVAVMLRQPVGMDDCAALGMVLYFCLPCCPPDSLDCTHYLCIVGVPGFIKSDAVFLGFTQWGMYSYQWLTYYATGVSHATR